MKNITGTPVEGSDFFGRAREIDALCNLLNDQNVLLLGPRRIGKTSICRKVMVRLKGNGHLAVEASVASCACESELVKKLCAALQEELTPVIAKKWSAVYDAFIAIAGKIRSLRVSAPVGAGSATVTWGEAAPEDWVETASDLVRLIIRADEPTLIYVDELPIFLYNILKNDPETGIQRVRRFLDWLRNDVQNLPGVNKVRWLISGSVGLDTLAQQHGMADAITGMKHETLRPFDEADAVAMLLQLAKAYNLSLEEDAARQMVAAIGWSQPYYLQLLFHNIRGLHAARSGLELSSLIDEAIGMMTDHGSDNDFHHWEKRLYQQLGDAEGALARVLLSRAAATPEGARPEMLLAELHERMPNAAPDEARNAFINLRDILERDGYWAPDESSGVRRLRFRLEPLRLWWKRRNTP